MAASDLHPAFPGLAFASRFEFEAFRNRHAFRLADRAAFEARLATRGEDVACPGTCAPCLRVCTFTSSVRDGLPLPGGRLLPRWPDQQLCDCADRLDATERALLHFLQARIGVSSWTTLLYAGEAVGMLARLRTIAGRVSAPAPIGAQTAPAHVLLAPRLAPLAASWAAMRGMLLPGGSLLFTTRFDELSAGTTADAGGRPAVFGWDILDQLRAAGFSRGAAHHVRSEELGYHGASNFLFAAEA